MSKDETSSDSVVASVWFLSLMYAKPVRELHVYILMDFFFSFKGKKKLTHVNLQLTSMKWG